MLRAGEASGALLANFEPGSNAEALEAVIEVVEEKAEQIPPE